MGLDMYAVRRFSVRPEDTVRFTQDDGVVVDTRHRNITYLIEEVMRWRKANQIHSWFVDNVQNGKDDCREYYVNEDKLLELMDVCERVIKGSKLVDGQVYVGTVYNNEHPNGLVKREPGKVIEDAAIAKKLLPTRAGFFFGCEEYDEGYLNDVIATRDWLRRMFDEAESGTQGDIYYSSSW